MIRKVIKLQNGCTSITLPKKWTDEFNLNGGEEVEVTAKGNKLIVSQNNLEKEDDLVERQLNTENKNRIVRLIRALYRQGHTQIKINFKDRKIKDRNGKEQSVSEIIEETTKQFQGFMITKQGKDYVIIESLANDVSFENTLRRAFFLLYEMNEIITTEIMEGKEISLEELNKIYANLKLMTDYCSRTLQRRLIDETSNIVTVHSTVEAIEGIGDSLRHIAKHFQKHKPNKKMITIAVITQEMIKLMQEIYYTKDQELIEQYFRIRDELYTEIYSNKNVQNQAIIENFAFVRWQVTKVIDNVL
jgi:phosphate uptake regulator